MSQEPTESRKASSRDARIEPLMESFVEKFRKGERPSVSEYAKEHPELAEEIRELFSAIIFMEELEAEDKAAGVQTSGSGTIGANSGEVARRLGEYRIVREIGRGGMGVVYEAEQESLGRHVALKVLPFQQLLEPRHLERFRREARAAAGLQHPNIVPVYGVGEDGGIHYYAMQFIPGQGLDEVLVELKRLRGTASVLDHQQGSPTPRSSASILLGDGASQAGSKYFHNVARLGVQAADALAYAHAQGVLHRDIKPSNLLLDSQGTLWVTDFGLAKAEGNDDVTKSGEIVGTFRYMAPERFGGWSDPRSDVYALGLTLYELITLRPAFEDTDRVRLVKKIMEEEAPRPRRIDPIVPRDLETVVMKAMAKEPAYRYQTASDIAADLRRYLAGKPIIARESNVWERSVKWVKRRPAVAGLVGLLVASLLTIAAVSFSYSTRLKAEAAKTIEVFKKAREPVTGLLTSMAKGRMSNPLESPQARLSLLENVVKLYELEPLKEFTAVKGLDSEGLFATQQAYHLLGDSHRELGDQKNAAQYYQAALDRLGALESEPANTSPPLDCRREKATLLGKQSLAFEAAGAPEEAAQAFRAATSLLSPSTTFRFVLLGKFTTGKAPIDLVAGDLDGDRDIDLITSNHESDTVSVILNKGNGDFAERVDFPVEKRPFALTTADLNGDYDLDLVVTNKFSYSISVLLNEGRGSFAPAVNYPLKSPAFGVKAGDLDGDGDRDLVAVAGGKNSICVLQNDGKGKFSDVRYFEVDWFPNALAVDDIDDDWSLDVAVACGGDGTGENVGSITILKGSGKGEFATARKVPSGIRPACLICTDLDHDGAVDLVAANHVAHTVAVMRNKGGGSFDPPELMEPGKAPYAVAAADFDGDGDPDVAVGNYGSSDVAVFINDKGSKFDYPLLFQAGARPFSLVTADFDGDHRMDLAAASFGASDVWVLRNLPLTAE